MILIELIILQDKHCEIINKGKFVFSIIFNKPFWVIGNKERGNARFDSLLKQLNLESRRFDISKINDIDLTIPIDWKKVNTIKKEWQEKSFDFLQNNL
ncbi:MAG: hypothetical protein J6Q48_01895 [Bacteroidaceae bacterium]|nr:hypothetical protein [Bacteroidaceae bacterium]